LECSDRVTALKRIITDDALHIFPLIQWHCLHSSGLNPFVENYLLFNRDSSLINIPTNQWGSGQRNGWI